MSKCVNFFRRFFLVFLTCVVTVISMAVAISPPVSAASVFSPFNFYQLYQMLHGLLLGDGGGNSQTFGEWLEENMTQTIGSGNDKHTFLLTPGEKLDDMMSEASIRLALGAACTDGGAAGMLKIKNLIDSWNEVYDTSDIGEIGSSHSGGIDFYVPDIPNGFFSSGGISIYSASNLEYPNLIYGDSILHDPFFSFLFSISSSTIDYSAIALVGNQYHLFVHSLIDGWHLVSKSSYKSCQYYFCYYGVRFTDSYTYKCRYDLIDYPLYNDRDVLFSNNVNLNVSCSQINSILNFLGCSVSYPDFDSVLSYLSSISISDDISISGKKYVDSDGFVGPVYAMPAAKQLITDTGTLSGLRLDVQTEDGTPDISAALDHAGVDNVDDLVAGVAAGTIPMSQVYEDMRVVPYVLTDVETGEVVTDLGVSATDAKTKAVALDKTLSIPKDVSAVDSYQVTGKTWDPSLSKYRLPLFNFFPFCLPYDAYQFLTMLDVTPVAPVFHVDTTPLFSHTKFFHASDGYKITLDLTKYEEIFQILRAGECLAIVVGLCLISYKLIHGGD